MRLDITSVFKDKPIFGNPIVLLQRIGNTIKNNIIKRTQWENVDPEGEAYKPYSTKPYFFNVGSIENPEYKTLKGGYAEFKNYMGGSGNIVNLESVKTVKEHMVVSTDILNVTNKYVEVGVMGINIKKAIWNENMGRSFLGISDSDEKDIDKIVDDYVDEELKKL